MKIFQKIYQSQLEGSRLLSWKIEKICLFSTIPIVMALLAAAYGKMFFPSDGLFVLDYIVSFFELVLIVFLIGFHNHLRTWLILSLIFAGWGGYALFWHVVKLPCACMGEAFAIPDGVSFVVDMVFYFLSLGMALLLKASKRDLLLFGMNGVLFALGGYIFAKWIFENLMLS